MSIDEKFDSIKLNRVAYSVRASQAILQYGVGAMVDFPNQTLMTAAPELWKENIRKIHDERLEKLLGVDFLGTPIGNDERNYKCGISYVRFPEWYFCPKCRRFKPIGEWVSDYQRKSDKKQLEKDSDMVNRPRCSICKQTLVVARIITVCEHGHIDDFPWIKWVHCQGGSREICSNPQLKFTTGASAKEGLEGLSITCQCGARANLKGAFNPGIFQALDEKYPDKYGFVCTGKHPWKNVQEKCLLYPKVMQRGGSSVYFPVISSSLVIPPYSSRLTTAIESCEEFEKVRTTIMTLKNAAGISAEMLNQIIDSQIEIAKVEIAREIKAVDSVDQIKAVLERKWKILPDNGLDSKEEYSTSSVKYRADEYAALGGYVSFGSEDGNDFQRESMDISEYNLPYIKHISLIHRVREVLALTGFSRIAPTDRSKASLEQGHYVSIVEEKSRWFPAYEVRGEGIFIEFDSDAINRWRTQNKELVHRIDILNGKYRESYIGRKNPRSISSKYLLLHTISHLLIRQLSFECGYSIASLKERIYCSDQAEYKEMSGILIYTAAGDSEGTLGGVVRQGRPDVFPRIFKKAIESAVTCSNDPVCRLSRGQGRESLNLSACYACALLPETSCENQNTILDRGVVVGTFDNKEFCFYYNQLYTENGWNLLGNERHSSTSTIHSKECTIIPNGGIDLFDADYKSIWSAIRQWSKNDKEIQLLNELIYRAHEFAIKEKPIRECEYMIPPSVEIYKASLLWKKSKVAYFTAEDEDEYIIAKKTDWICFCGNDPNINVDVILKNLIDR